MTNYLKRTWEEIHYDSYLLAKSLSNKKFKGLIAISRGGLVPASIIAYELGCQLIETLSIASYEDLTQGAITILKEANVPNEGKDFLIVDDLVDSGNTAIAIKKLYPQSYFVCLYAKPIGKPYTDEFIMEFQQDTWIIFPWNLEPSLITQKN